MAGLAHLKPLVVFVIDPNIHAGMSLTRQLTLRQELRDASEAAMVTAFGSDEPFVVAADFKLALARPGNMPIRSTCILYKYYS